MKPLRLFGPGSFSELLRIAAFEMVFFMHGGFGDCVMGMVAVRIPQHSQATMTPERKVPTPYEVSGPWMILA